MTSASPPTVVGLIPARAGSKRVPNKNIRRLGDHPVIAYTIAAALESGVFQAVIVSTDSDEFASIAQYYGAEVPFPRPAEFATDTSPDIEWIEYTLKRLQTLGRGADCFSILRPTSPFRKAETIRRAWQTFLAAEGIDSLRAIEKCKQHPGKMWIVRGERMFPLLPFGPAEQPWHSSQYPTLPEVYVQNASLEIAWSRVVFEGRTIAGNALVPFLTQGDEGYDVNDVADWIYAEHLLATGQASLPPVRQAPYPISGERP
jgi:CMP-N-acetylneuraminic acid synthetase